jgi:hypothetical protein|tara:strand:+ start:132 stop:608 length:477 start_codon:yes stop_codon:yes gene_type:complete
MKLSANFTLKELTKSDTAIRKGISNEPNTDEIEKLKLLCETILQPVRDKFGAVTVTSGYRSPELCQAIGSSVNSQHTKAEAVDFEVEGVDNADVAYWIKDNIPNWDQMILEFYILGQPNSGWIHCSITSKLERKQFLSAYKEDGKTKYKPILGDIRCG